MGTTLLMMWRPLRSGVCCLRAPPGPRYGSSGSRSGGLAPMLKEGPEGPGARA